MNRDRWLLRDVRDELLFILSLLFIQSIVQKTEFRSCFLFIIFVILTFQWIYRTNGKVTTTEPHNLRSALSSFMSPKNSAIKTDWKNQNAVDSAACGIKNFRIRICVRFCFVYSKSQHSLLCRLLFDYVSIIHSRAHSAMVAYICACTSRKEKKRSEAKSDERGGDKNGGDKSTCKVRLNTAKTTVC